jgi:predicted PhzF superfamily epimerase YddE/YHI9
MILERVENSQLEVYQIHAFTKVVHGGNPAGVCLLDTWLDDASLAAIARDLGPSVTAFVLTSENRQHPLRWFTCAGQEVSSFCGHATFSAAYVLLRLKGEQEGQMSFLTLTGMRQVGTFGDELSMTVPNWPAEECTCPEVIMRSIAREPSKCFRGQRDYMLVFDSMDEVAQLTPDFALMRTLGHQGIVATARQSNTEIVLRFFCPGFSIDENEDHATGSAFSTLAPYWAARLGATSFSASQLSSRGGSFRCSMENGIITVRSHCATFLTGTVSR